MRVKDVDYYELLVKYIAHIQEEEGIDYLGVRGHSFNDADLTALRLAAGWSDVEIQEFENKWLSGN